MAAAKTAGSFLGGLFNNPGTVAILLGAAALFIFRDKISDFFQKGFDTLSEGLVNVNLGDINVPNPLEGFDLGNIFQGFQDTLSSIAGQTVDGITIPADTTINDDGTISSTTGPTFSLSDFEKQEALNQLELNRLRSQLENALFDIPVEENLSGSEFATAINQEEFRERGMIDSIIEPIRTIIGGGETVIVPTGDELNLGGGPSFIGGSTTFGDNIIDTFSEVLNIFPDLRANQIDDLLLQNQGLTASEFRLINPIPETSLSSEGVDPDQALLNASGGFTGLTPTQIAQLLTGGNISNF